MFIRKYFFEFFKNKYKYCFLAFIFCISSKKHLFYLLTRKKNIIFEHQNNLKVAATRQYGIRNYEKFILHLKR